MTNVTTFAQKWQRNTKVIFQLNAPESTKPFSAPDFDLVLTTVQVRVKMLKHHILKSGILNPTTSTKTAAPALATSSRGEDGEFRVAAAVTFGRDRSAPTFRSQLFCRQNNPDVVFVQRLIVRRRNDVGRRVGVVRAGASVVVGFLRFLLILDF